MRVKYEWMNSMDDQRQIACDHFDKWQLAQQRKVGDRCRASKPLYITCEQGVFLATDMNRPIGQYVDYIYIE